MRSAEISGLEALEEEERRAKAAKKAEKAAKKATRKKKKAWPWVVGILAFLLVAAFVFCFFWVNPFCTAFNPAAKTKLNQSGDVSTTHMLSINENGTTANASVTIESNKISLKIMTLNNSRQKINDCLGNPIEIGIAVIWRVVDTAKAVFNVDNFKEYLSLQCDSALRNVIKIYPYDVAPNVDTTGDGVADDGSLRGSSDVVASRIKDEIQERTGGICPLCGGVLSESYECDSV